MHRLSFVMPYYMNAGMLSVQFATWAAYPQALKDRIEIVLVDDGSPEDPAIGVPRPAGLPSLRIYRVLIDKPWNQHGARNLGAREAEGPWLFLTDMDHVLPAWSLERLLLRENAQRIYTFARVDAPDLKPTVRPNGTPKPHPNTFAMTRELFWRIGGYDERFCGIYGTDGLFRSRAFDLAREYHLGEISIIRYPREVVADASTRTLPRKEGRGDERAKLQARIRAAGTVGRIETLTFPWERVL